MTPSAEQQQLVARDMKAILDVATALAAPFDLATMLAEVINAAKQVLDADRGSVWLYDARADELVLEIATDMRTVRVPAGAGLVGACARRREIINVPDCYADPRFDATVDRKSGYRTRCMLTLPLVDHKDVLVGVMQVLNKKDGVFDAKDEAMATALAAQCAVALQRVQMTEALVEGERMRRELEMARVVQMSTLPSAMPSVEGYSVYGAFQPAELTGGDTYDLMRIGDELLVVLADATGHGIAPALSVTQMHAMLRVVFHIGTDLQDAVVQVNNQLSDWLADDRFITAFIGLLDPRTHRLRYHSAGQAPILHFRAASGECAQHKPTSFPLGAMRLSKLKPAAILEMAPGDILVMLSDGIYEQANAAGEEFGVDRVRDLVRAHQWQAVATLGQTLLDAVKTFAQGAPQEDDITIVLVRRDADGSVFGYFERDANAVPDIVALTDTFFEREGLDASMRQAVDLTLEELFTNMVKYSASSARVRIDLTRADDGVVASLTDYDVEPFDVTKAPDADVTLPLEQRKPGGLGLHLIRRVVDSIEYEYSAPARQSRIVFRKTPTRAAEPAPRPESGERSAGD